MKTTRRASRITLLAFGMLFILTSFAAHAVENGSKKEPIKPYPLKVCIVTDNDLGSMGDERTFVYEGQEIKICCKPCEKKFLKNPEKYLTKLAPTEVEKKP